MRKILLALLVLFSIGAQAQTDLADSMYKKNYDANRGRAWWIDSVFKITKLPNGTAGTDSLVVWDATTKRFKKITPTVGGSTGTKSVSGTTSLQLVNDVTTPKRGYFYGTNVKDSARGFQEIEENFLGKIYDSTSWNNLSSFINNGATVSVTSNKLAFSGGAGTFTQTLDLNYPSMLDKWKISAKVKVAASGGSYGFGIGKRSLNTYGAPNALARFNMLSGAGEIILNGGLSNTALATSASSLSFSTNDYILLTVERDGYTIRATAKNLTTNSTYVSCSYTYITNPNGDPFFDNTGTYSIYSLGGSFTVDSLCVSSNVPKNARIAVIGDSKMQGFNVTAQAQRVADLLNTKFKSSYTISGGFDRTIEVSKRINEILALRPQQVVLAIGSNDVRAATESSATYYARYDSITTALTGAGIRVIHTPLYETSISLSGLRAHILATFNAADIIDCYDLMQEPGVLDDGVHPNNHGDSLIYNAIVNSYKLYGGNDRYGGSSSGGGSATALDGTLTQYKVPVASASHTLIDGSITDNTNITLPKNVVIGNGTQAQVQLAVLTGPDHRFEAYAFGGENYMNSVNVARTLNIPLNIAGNPTRIGYGSTTAFERGMEFFSTGTKYNLHPGYSGGLGDSLWIVDVKFLNARIHDSLAAFTGGGSGLTSFGTPSGTSNANGATYSGGVGTLTYGDATNPGIMKKYTAAGSNTDGTLTQSAINTIYAPLASPTLTGTPTAPTASAATNTTQIATTAFVQQEISSGYFQVVQTLSAVGQTAAYTGSTYTTPNDGTAHTYIFTSYAKITAYTSGTITPHIAYTSDDTNASESFDFYNAGATTAGLTGGLVFSHFVTQGEIRAKPNTTIVFSTGFSGTMTYNVTSTITKVR